MSKAGSIPVAILTNPSTPKRGRKAPPKKKTTKKAPPKKRTPQPRKKNPTMTTAKKTNPAKKGTARKTPASRAAPKKTSMVRAKTAPPVTSVTTTTRIRRRRNPATPRVTAAWQILAGAAAGAVTLGATEYMASGKEFWAKPSTRALIKGALGAVGAGLTIAAWPAGMGVGGGFAGTWLGAATVDGISAISTGSAEKTDTATSSSASMGAGGTFESPAMGNAPQGAGAQTLGNAPQGAGAKTLGSVARLEAVSRLTNDLLREAGVGARRARR